MAIGFLASISAVFAGERSVYEHWSDVPAAQRCSRMFDDLQVTPRRLHLPSAVVRFVDLPSAEPDAEAPWLLIHGYAGSLCDFGPMAARLAKRHRVLAFDLPGFGESASADEQYTIDSYVQTLREFLNRVEARPVHLVCHSLGGHVCIGAALAQPRTIETLTLIDTAGIFEKSGFIKQLAKHKGGLNLGQMVVERGRSLIDWTEGDQAFLRRFVLVDPTTWTAVASFRSSYRKQVRTLRMPTLILWGMDDPLFPVEDSAFLFENVPGAKLYIIDGAGHCPNETHAGTVVELVEKFVRERKNTPP